MFFAAQADAKEKVHLQHYSTENGLSQSEVLHLYQDPKGFLWVGTREGLNRFDGYQFKLIGGPGGRLNNLSISSLYEDSRNQLWIGAPIQGGSDSIIGYRLDLNSHTFHSVHAKIPGEDFQYSSIDKLAPTSAQNMLWLATSQHLYLYNYDLDSTEYYLGIQDLLSNTAKSQNIDPSIHIIRDFIEFEDYLLIATSLGLYAVEKTDKTIIEVNALPFPVENDDQLNYKGLIFGDNNELFIQTVQGFFKTTTSELKSLLYEKREIRFEVISPSLNIWKVIKKGNYYLVATDDGLYQYKDNQLEFIVRYSGTPYNVFDDDVVSLLIDRESNVWMGSREDGLFMWHPNDGITQTIYNTRGQTKTLASNDVWSLNEMSNGNILIGTGSGLTVLNSTTNESQSFFINTNEKQVFGDESITNAFELGDSIWLNRYMATMVIDKNTMQPKNEVTSEQLASIFSKPSRAMYKLDESKVLIFQKDKVHLYDDKTKQVSEIEALKGEKGAPKYYHMLMHDKQANAVLLSSNNATYKYELGSGIVSQIHKFSSKHAENSNPQSSVLVDGNYWIAYYGSGIHIVNANNNAVEKILGFNELGSTALLDIFTDRDDFVWVSTNDGLVRINPKNYQSELFSRKDGFVSDEFNGGTKLKASNGSVYLGSPRGVVQINPEAFTQERSFQPKLELTSLTLLSRPNQELTPSSKALQVAHDDFGLTIEFSSNIFHKTQQIKYKYFITGSSRTDPIITDENKLFFPKLAEGESEIIISSIDYLTGNETAPIVIKIKSLPAPWRSPLALLSYLIIIVTLAAFIYKRKVERQQALLKSHQILKESEQRLQLALTGGNTGLWDWQSRSNIIFEPRLMHIFADAYIKLDERLQYIHPDDQDEYASLWQSFLLHNKTSKEFNFTYRLQGADNNWHWYRDLARVTERDDFDNPTRITGTYTDITESKDTRDKMQLFFQAFESTRDIIIILNNQFEIIACNQSFIETTRFDSLEKLNKPIDFLFRSSGELLSPNVLTELFNSNDHCESEGTINRKYQQPLSVLINATKFLNEQNQLNYVFSITDITEQKEAQSKLKRLANYDSLTGLPNRALLSDRIIHAIEHARRREHKIAVFFIDLDRFKHINDSLGHDIGDLLLKDVAQILQTTVRENDTVARLGGDEFVVVLEDIQSIDTPTRISKNIIEAMNKTFLYGDNEVNTSPSIGIALYPDDGVTLEELLKHADTAMYHAKAAGRNNFKFFLSQMNEQAQERISLENKLRNAIKQNEFYLDYQPQLAVRDDTVIGFEALARWKTSDGEVIPPSDFIPLAEELGIIIPLTEELIEAAVCQQLKWQSLGYPVKVAVNLSARHLHHYDLIQFLQGLQKKYQADLSYLEFELTESILMQDITNAISLVKQLNAMGIKLALDDFGTGYSSLKYLHQLPIHKLKIDRSFVWQIGKMKESEAIIETIVSLSKSLHLKTVVEGVETESQLSFVKDLNVDSIQGFYFSKPISSEMTIEYLKQHNA